MKLRTEDGTVLDTTKARQRWTEATRWDGQNHISVNTGSQWAHQTLYLSSRDRYYLVHRSDWQGSTPSAEIVSDQEAARWLALNNHELTAKLVAVEATE